MGRQKDKAEKLKVLHVVNSLRTGGLERLVLNLTGAQPAMGVSPVAAALETAGDLAPELESMGIPLEVLHKRRGIDLSMAAGLIRLIRAHKVRVLHAHNPGAAFYSGLAGLATGRPVIFTKHGASFNVNPSVHRLTWVDSLLCKKVVCVSQDSRDQALAATRVAPSKLSVIYNGIDPGRFRPDADRRGLTRAELGLGPDDAAYISVGRISPEKDYPTLLRAFSRVAAGHKQARLFIVGDGPELGACQRIAAELGLGEKAAFLGQRGDVARLLGACDVFCLSSLSEGVSIALLEAMAAGLPAAATLVGGTPEVVRDGITGWLVRPNDPDALARAMAGFALDRPGAERMGLAARLRVLERFSLMAMAGAYDRLYRRVIS